ncbi:hypothetical protein V6N11_030710 [Hibiscus sabdariffa]|uniref:S-locus receptor kinase C-terminal domain-containing protein n=1 Tax=Hibiscus sabdariffa TaxID=183260 RepID=A0ABR2NBQ1_9ROSI
MPSMSEVVLMLSSDVPLQQPKQPGCFTKRDLIEASADNRKPIVLTILQSQWWFRQDKMISIRATLAEKVLVHSSITVSISSILILEIEGKGYISLV